MHSQQNIKAPTCFGVITIIKERTIELAKFTVLKQLIKIHQCC